MAEKGTPQHDAESLRMIAGWLDKDSLRDPAAFLRRVADDIESRATDGQRAGEEHPTFVLMSRPGMCVVQKGPFHDRKMIEDMVRGLYELHPDATCIVADMPYNGAANDGREWVAMYGDRRRKALAAAPTPPAHHQQQQHVAAQGFAGDRVPENRDFTSTTPPTHVLVPVDKLTVGDCYRFGLDVAKVRAMGADTPPAAPVYDKSVVKRIATQMGWTPPAGDAGQDRDRKDAAYAEGYEDALAHAAFYVRDHCIEGEYHADVIEQLRRPARTAIEASKGEKG